MTICGSQACGCALVSSTLSVSGGGTPGSPWVIEQAEFTDITALQVAVDNLEAAMVSVTADVVGLQTLTVNQGASITRLDAMQSGASSSAAGTTSGTTALVVDSFTFPTLTTQLQIWTFTALNFSKTVATDVFSLATRFNGAAAFSVLDRVGASNASMVNHSGPHTAAAATTPLIELLLTRSSGTGTATVTGGAFRWLALPT